MEYQIMMQNQSVEFLMRQIVEIDNDQLMVELTLINKGVPYQTAFDYQYSMTEYYREALKEELCQRYHHAMEQIQENGDSLFMNPKLEEYYIHLNKDNSEGTVFMG